MWSLPDINRMNSEAHAKTKKLERAVRTGRLDGKKLTCEYEDASCNGELHHTLWYDIFSDDPKGLVTLCERHDGYYGSPAEGYFYCDDCGRTFTENYTWELYYHVDDGGISCLNCYRDRELADADNWLELSDVRIDELTFSDVRRAKHLIAVGQNTPTSLTYIENVEMDSSSGGRLTGFSSSESTPDGAVQELRDILTRLKDEGRKRAILILDAAYQFSVSVGVYVDAEQKAEAAA